MSNINDHNPACSVITGDIDARPHKWWALDKENSEERKISFLTFSAGYSQLIDQPTHITKESSSCIDLIFTSNPSFISASGVGLSLYEKCHHNLTYWKINFDAPLPPPYIRKVWDYKFEKLENIQRSVSGNNWDFIFQGKTIHNFIPNKKIRFNYKDPLLMTKIVKSKLRDRSNLVKRYNTTRSEKFGSQLDWKSKTWFFTFLNVYVSWSRQNSDLTVFTSKIQVFYRPEWTKGGTPWKRILTFFKYKNEYHKQLELKK